MKPFHETRAYFFVLCGGWAVCAAIVALYVTPVAGQEMAIYADIFRGM